MFKCFDDCVLTCIDIHMFDIRTHMHTRWSCNRLEGISDHVVEHTCTQILWKLCLNAKEIGRLKICALGCFNTHMLVYSHDHILICANDQNACMFSCFVDNMLTCVLALTITHSHVYMLWWSHAPMFSWFDI